MDIADEPLKNNPGKQSKMARMLETFVAKFDVDDAEILEAIEGAERAAIEGEASINEVLNMVAEVLERKKSKVKDLPKKFRAHAAHYGLDLPDPMDVRRLLGAYASSSSELPPQTGGNQIHRQALVQFKMLELSNHVVRILKTPAWRQYAATKPVVESSGGPIPLRMPPPNAEEYLEYLSTDWHGGKQVSRPDEAFCILRAVQFGLIYGPVLRPEGGEKIDFVAFGPTFEGYENDDGATLRKHLSTLPRDYLAHPERFEGNEIKLDLKYSLDDSADGIERAVRQIEKKILGDPAMHVVVVSNHMPSPAVMELQNRYKGQILPFHDDVLDKVGLDASGLWSFPV